MIKSKVRIHSCFATRLAALLITGSMFITNALDSFASDNYWDNTLNSNAYYDINSNWNSSITPGASDTAIFDLDNTYQVWWDGLTANSTPAVGSLQVTNGNVTFLNLINTQLLLNINGTGSSTDVQIIGSAIADIRGLHFNNLGGTQISDQGSLIVDGNHAAGSKFTIANNINFNNNGSMLIQNGGQVSNNFGLIANQANSVSTVTVLSPGSTWTNQGNLYPGNSGHGTLNIFSGGLVTSNIGSIGRLANSQGFVNISGQNAAWNNTTELYIGENGNATVNILDQGSLSTTNAYVGTFGTSTSTVTVEDQNSVWNNTGNLFIGNNGYGGVDIRNGGKVTSNIASIGRFADSTGFVGIYGQNSLLENTSAIYIGERGEATLNIESGGGLNTNNAYIGFAADSKGTVNITHPNTTWNNTGNLFVGVNGPAFLNIEDQAAVNVSGNLTIGNLGWVTLDGGSLTINGTLDCDGGVFRKLSGTLEFSGQNASWQNPNDLLLTTVLLNINQGANVSNVKGSIDDDGTVIISGTNSTWTNSGLLSVGSDSSGTLIVSDGGKVITDAESRIAGYAGSTGHVTVTGQNSQWNSTGDLFVGRKDKAVFHIQDGATVTNASGIISNDYDATEATMVIVSGHNSTWTSNGALLIGENGLSMLTIEDGALVTNTSSTISLFGDASVKVTGQNSKWINSSRISIATFGRRGTLDVENGALVSSDSAAIGVWGLGTANVNGNNARWIIEKDLTLGGQQAGTSTLNITNGGFVSNRNAHIAHITTTANVTVDGQNSIWQNTGNLSIGGSTIGSLKIQNNAKVFVQGNLYMQNFSQLTINQGTLEINGSFNPDPGFFNFQSGQIDVIGSGANMYSTSSLSLGSIGSGILNINQAGKVALSSLYIGSSSNAAYTGQSTINGLDSKLILDNLFVGYHGKGTLNIENQAYVFVQNDIKIGDSATATGEVNISGAGSTLASFNNLIIGDAGNASLNIRDHATVDIRGLTGIVNDGKLLIHNGSLITQNLVTENLTIQLDPSLNLATHTPFITVKSQANLDGTLTIDLLDNFIPTPGTEIDILTYITRFGTFDDLIVNNAPAGLNLTVDYNDLTRNVTLIAAAHLTGDANLDGSVNIQDLAVLASGFNGPGNWFTGDFNYDNVINIQDLALLASNFNNSILAFAAISSNGIGGASVIPTPSSLSILALSALTLLKRRRGQYNY